MEKVLSIIVPAYNVERYIEKCLDSFWQVKQRKKLEVLVINDGSLDRTEELAEEYCRKDPEVFHLYTKENGGHGSAINYGRKLVTGRYFRVVDADDWVDTGEMDRYLEFLEQTKADLVASDYQCIQDETYRVLSVCRCVEDSALYGKTVEFDAIAEQIPLIRIHSFTVRTAVYAEHEISIDSYRYYVDFEYILFPIPYVKTIAFYQGSLYQYRLGRNGQSVSIGSMQKNRKNHRQVIERLLECYDSHTELSSPKRAYLEMGISKIVENQFQIFISLGNRKGILREMKEFDLGLKQKYPGIYNAVSKKSIWMLRRTGYVILPFAYAVYCIVKR